MIPEKIRRDIRKCAESMRGRNQLCFANRNLDEYSTAMRVLAYLDAEGAAPDFTHVADGYVEADAMDDYIGVRGVTPEEAHRETEA